MNQDKTFSGELVLLVLFLIRGRFVPRCRSMPSSVPEGVFIGGEKNQSMLLQIPSFILADRFYPFLGQWHGLMSFKIESNHDGFTNTFHLIGFRVNDLLNQMKAFGTYLRDGCLYSDVVRCENLLNEIRFDMNNDNANLSQSTPGHTEPKYSVFPKS